MQGKQVMLYINMTNKNFEDSAVERKNVLNNQVALNEIVNKLDLKGFIFEGELKFTRKYVADYLEVDDSTIIRYLNSAGNELETSGYKAYKGQKLKEVKEKFAPLIDAGSKTTQLGLFNFKAFINLAMLLKEGEKARYIRSLIINVFLEVLDEKLGKHGERKFINQKDNNWLDERYMGEIYRSEFTEALDKYVGGSNFKFAKYTDKVYDFLFLEKAKEYRELVKLNKGDATRDSFYTELITLISSFETGLAHDIRKAYNLNNSRYLSHDAVDKVLDDFFTHPAWKPQIDSVRRKMVSRDSLFRGVEHDKLSHYLTPIDPEDFEKFLHSISIKQLTEEKREQLKQAKAKKL